jgi:hypothetical protein
MMSATDWEWLTAIVVIVCATAVFIAMIVKDRNDE